MAEHKTTSFTILRRTFLLAKNFSDTAAAKTVVSWSGDILTLNDMQIDTRRLSPYLRAHITDTELFFDEKIFRGLKPWEPKYDELVDDYRNKEDGYSFTTDLRNGFHQRRMLLIEGFSNDDLKQTFWIHTHNGKHLNPMGCRRWLQDCEEGLERLFSAMFESWGGPSRAPELGSIVIGNLGGRRSVFWQDGLLIIVVWFQRKRSKKGKENMVVHAVPPRLSRLFALYLAYVVPTMAYISQIIFDQETSDIYKAYLFSSFGKAWDARRYTRIMKGSTKACFGVSLGIHDWRHACIAISRQYFPQQYQALSKLRESQRQPTNIIDAQGAHTSTIALNHYAVPADILLKIPGALRAAFIQFSCDWFTWLDLAEIDV